MRLNIRRFLRDFWCEMNYDLSALFLEIWCSTMNDWKWTQKILPIIIQNCLKLPRKTLIFKFYWNHPELPEFLWLYRTKILSIHYSSSPKSTLLHITGIDSRYQCSSTTLKGGMRSLKIDRVYQITQFERILARICDGNWS